MTFIRWIKQNPFSAIFIFLGLISATTLVLFIVNFFGNGISKQPADWATFATYVSGTIGTLIGLVSIVLLYQTLMRQTELSRLQQFESSFFNLLENQRDIVKSMKGKVSYIQEDHKSFDENLGGINFIQAIADAVEIEFKKIEWPREYAENNYKISELKELGNCTKYVSLRFLKIYDRYKAELGHYFRHLYHIIKHVDKSEIKDKKKYIDILQAQMSDDELYLTFLSVVAGYTEHNFYTVTSRYKLFQNLLSRDAKFDVIRTTAFPDTRFKDFSPKLPSFMQDRI